MCGKADHMLEIFRDDLQINELQGKLKETVALDEQQQEPAGPDYEIIEQEAEPADEKNEKPRD